MSEKSTIRILFISIIGVLAFIGYILYPTLKVKYEVGLHFEVALHLKDRSSLQFAMVRKTKNGHWCGYVGGKGSHHHGFTRFHYLAVSGRTFVEIEAARYKKNALVKQHYPAVSSRTLVEFEDAWFKKKEDAWIKKRVMVKQHCD